MYWICSLWTTLLLTPWIVSVNDVPACNYMYKYIFVYYITVTTFKYVKGGPDREAQELV